MGLRGLDDRVIAVTGGASGVGLATATRLVAEGARVAVLDIDGEAAERVAESLGSARAWPAQLDVSAEDQVTRAFATAREHFGRLDGLHNNAAILIGGTPLVDFPTDSFDALMRVNLRGAFLCLREMLRIAAAAKASGWIVNTASGTALRGAPGAGAYSAAKAGVIALTRTAAIEAAPLVRVNAVVPGPLDTPMTAGASAERQTQTIAKVPQGRIGSAEEVAALVAWLFSDEAPYVTGGVYVIDGGETA
jgi:3-oxoacyl-[acyl-carrier protein] reductase